MNNGYKNPPIENLLIEKKENGAYELLVTSNLIGDVRVTLSPAVLFALCDTALNAVKLQLELDKLPPQERENFPLEAAINIVRGQGWFKALDPEAARAKQLIGAFGAKPAQKGN